MRGRRRWPLIAVLLPVLLLESACQAPLAASGKPTGVPLARRFRRPVALVAVDGGRQLLVANRDSGTISRIDVAKRRVLDETSIGGRPSDLAVTPDGRRVLVADAGRRQIVVLDLGKGQPAAVARVPLADEPAQLVVDPRGGWAGVTSPWSRSLTLLDLSKEVPIPRTRLALPMAARHLLWLPGTDMLVVADAVGGQLSVVDVAAGRVRRTHQLSAHNISGLALSPSGRHLVLSHQVLNSAARSSPNDVLWGLLITNNLRRIPLPDLLADSRLPVRPGSVVLLGQAGNAAGDPAGVAVRHDGSFVVALSGVHQLGIGHHDRIELTRVGTGHRPTRVWLAPDRRHAVVVATLDDRLSFIDLDTARRVADVSLGPQPEQGAHERGERLFFDARLSRDGWMSCHSCHTNGHSNGLLADTLGDGGFGSGKRVLSLLGTIDTRPWAWDGRMASLRDQMVESVTTTMRGARPTSGQLHDLEIFVSSLVRPAPGRPPESSDERAMIARGRQLFRDFRCGRCHTPPLYTSPDIYDVGLAGPNGPTRSNPPSLRGVGQRRRMFHDNRARSLEEVFRRFRHQLPRKFSPRESRDLVRFLEGL